MSDFLQNLPGVVTVSIWVVLGVHLFGFALLFVWWRRDLKSIAGTLDRFTRGIAHQSRIDPNGHLSDQIEAFLADVNEVLDGSRSGDDRQGLRHRINVLDENRSFLDSMSFDTWSNVARSMIEAYPLAGVLGTILAIGVALPQIESAGAAGEGAGVMAGIMGQFGQAIWSTFAGIVAAILLLGVNSVLEPRFGRLAENRRNVRQTVARVKRELSLATVADAESPEPPEPADSAGTSEPSDALEASS